MNKLIRQEQLFELISAHFKEITREPGVLFWGIIFPILMSLGLGIAFTKKGDIIRNVAVIEKHQINNPYPDSTSKIETFLQNNTEKIESTVDEPVRYKIIIKDDKLGNTVFLFQKTDWQSAMVLLKRGNLSVVIDEKDGQIEYHFDPLNLDAQLTYLKLSKIFSRKDIIPKESDENIEPLTVSGTRYIDFLVPGLIAMGIMMSCLWGMSYSIIEKRTKKLLRRMVATPMKKSHFLIALMTIRIGMNFVESALLFIFAHIVFDITILGNIPALFTIFISGNIAFAGIAIFVSSHTANTEIGNGLINVVVLPMMVLSGIFFSYHNFPAWSIPFIQKLPLTLLADGIRSIFIEGAGYSEISLPSFILMAIGIFFFSTGLKIFKWH
jgi:ABC-type multidrug transport system permease subunit